MIRQEQASGKSIASSKDEIPSLRDVYGKVPYDIESENEKNAAKKKTRKNQNKRKQTCPFVRSSKLEHPTHYCVFLASQYAMMCANEMSGKDEFHKLLSNARDSFGYGICLGIFEDVWAEWFCGWNSKSLLISSSRSIIETLLRDPDTGRHCAMVIVAHDSGDVYFLGNTFSFFCFPCTFMAKRVATYTYLDGTEEPCFEWWNMPAVIH